MAKLDEIDFLRLKNIDIEIERLALLMEVARSKLAVANYEMVKLNPQRTQVYQSLVEKYKIGDFNYHRETGEIIPVNKPAVP